MLISHEAFVYIFFFMSLGIFGTFSYKAKTNNFGGVIVLKQYCNFLKGYCALAQFFFKELEHRNFTAKTGSLSCIVFSQA